MLRVSCLVLTADCIEPEVPPVTRKDSDTHTPRGTKTRQRGQQKSYRSPTHAGTDQKVVACKIEKGSGWEECTCRGSEGWVGSSHSRRSKPAVNNHSRTTSFCQVFLLSCWLQLQNFQVRVFEIHGDHVTARASVPFRSGSISPSHLREKPGGPLRCLSQLLMTVYEASTARLQPAAELLPRILTLFPESVYCWSMHGW